ncbi:unnamed protein product [Amoebophrya sp. A120]|nr:unnamed protein product [Amoebophrya sp. A120]|eukprot:GSA120T00025866001.1
MDLHSTSASTLDGEKESPQDTTPAVVQAVPEGIVLESTAKNEDHAAACGRGEENEIKQHPDEEDGPRTGDYCTKKEVEKHAPFVQEFNSHKKNLLIYVLLPILCGVIASFLPADPDLLAPLDHLQKEGQGGVARGRGPHLQQEGSNASPGGGGESGTPEHDVVHGGSTAPSFRKMNPLDEVQQIMQNYRKGKSSSSTADKFPLPASGNVRTNGKNLRYKFPHERTEADQTDIHPEILAALDRLANRYSEEMVYPEEHAELNRMNEEKTTEMNPAPSSSGVDEQGLDVAAADSTSSSTQGQAQQHEVVDESNSNGQRENTHSVRKTFIQTVPRLVVEEDSY